MEYLTHTPIDGERIDMLAHKYYGDPNQIEPILRANPILFGKLATTAGQNIIIPMIDPPPADPQIGLPPWRA